MHEEERPRRSFVDGTKKNRVCVYFIYFRTRTTIPLITDTIFQTDMRVTTVQVTTTNTTPVVTNNNNKSKSVITSNKYAWSEAIL